MALIKTSNSVPSVYINQSRDFQTIGHLYEAVFNSSKLATDMVDTMIPNNNFDERLISLSSTTRGFTTKHEYSSKDLSMILSAFASLLRIKGTKKAIDSAINVLLRSQGISDPYKWMGEESGKAIDAQNKYFNLGLSERITDRVLLFDLFEYILPFGFTYRITNYSVSPVGENITKIATTDKADITAVSREDDLANSAIVSANRRTTQTILEATTMLPKPPITIKASPAEDPQLQVDDEEEENNG